MDTSKHKAMAEVIALNQRFLQLGTTCRNSIHDLALEIVDNDYDADKLTSKAMSLILDWSDPKYDDYLINTEVPSHEL